MLIFFDTEFTELGIDPLLISIGLVSEDGREFYAELSDTWGNKHASDFVRETVMPLLEGGKTRMAIHELTLRLGNWIEGFEEPVVLATDSLSWDWPWISEIFEYSGTWPANLAKLPEILHQETEFNLAIEEAFASGLRRHHALDDAKANRLAWLAINGLSDSRNEVALKARITQMLSGGFLAELTTGPRVIADNVDKIALALHDLGLDVDNVHCADWREGDLAPGAGEAIAIKVEMRRLDGG